MGLLPWEKTTTCPYDPTHQITSSRIQKHLVKCRRNHQESEHVICIFNASHHIPKAEEQYHMAHCTDRRIVELASYNLQKTDIQCQLEIPKPKPREFSTSLFMQEELEGEEDWDKEMSGVKLKSYDPQLKCQKTNVLRRLQGATPSERKKFYAEEKKRHEELRALDDSSEDEEDEEEENSKGGFHSPRPSLFTQEPLVRPSNLSKQTTEKVEVGKSSQALPSSRRSLAETEKGGGRKSITSRLLSLVPNNTRSSFISNTIREDVAEEISLNDTLDSALGRLALGGGRERASVGPAPLRKPKLEK